MKKLLIGLTLISSLSSLASFDNNCTYRIDADVTNKTISHRENILKKHGFKYDPSSNNSLVVSSGEERETLLSHLNPIALIVDYIGNSSSTVCDDDDFEEGIPQRQCYPKGNSGSFVTPHYYIITDLDGEPVGKIVRKFKRYIDYNVSDQSEFESEEVLINKCKK